MEQKLSDAKTIFSRNDRGNVQNFRFLNKGIVVLLLSFFSFFGFGQMATETFNTAIPATWTVASTTGATTDWAHTADGYAAGTGGAAVINPAEAGQGYYLITPQIVVPSNGELRFYSKLSATADPDTTYTIMASTSTQPDIVGFTTTIATLTGLSTSGYQEVVVELPAGIPVGFNVYLAFVATTQTGTPTGVSWFVDEARVVEGCIEVEAANVSFPTVTTASVTVNWTHPSATDFEIQVIPAGDTPAASGTAVTGTSHTQESLDDDTQYSVYIKSLCADGIDSSWAGPFNFTTEMFGMACDSPIVITATASSPYLFSANLMDYPNADTITYTTQGTNCLPASVTQNYLLGNKIFFTYTPTEDGVITISQMTKPWISGTQCWGNAASGVFIYEDCTQVGVECLAGLYTSATNQPKKIENFPVTAGTEYTIVMSSNYSGTTTSICFDFSLSFTTCPAPSIFSYENLLQESVTFSWNNPVSIADSWEYVVLPVADPAPTGAGTATSTNEDVAITGLTAGTAYNLYVRPVCSGTPGVWGTPFSFTTQCEVFSTPYSTDFVGSNATNPEPCWTSVDANGDGVKWSYLGGWQEGYMGYATLQTNTNQNFNNDYLVSPQVTFDGVTQKRLRYSHQITGGTSSSYSIRISTTGIGEDNFTYELLPETVITNTAWQEVIYNIPQTITGDVNIAWKVSPVGSGQNTTRISLTNVYIEDKPMCPDPLSPALVAGSVTTTSAQFTWAVGDEETQWEVIAVPINAPAPDENTVGILTSSNNPYTYEDLDPAKRYKFYVRAYCSDVYQSEWVGPVNFTTDCIVFSTPFFESFDDTDDNTQKFCWSVTNANADASQWQMQEENPSIQGSPFWFNPTVGYDDWLISPAISGEGVKELKYKYRAVFSPLFAVSRYGIQVLISYTDTDPASFTELIPLYDFTNTDYLEKSIYFNATGTFYIAFRVPPTFVIAPGTSILNIDDVSITDAPDCPNPSNLAVANITTTNADFTWTPAFEEEAWEIAVVPQGTTPTEGTETAVANYQTTTLLPQTNYDAYVRAVCSDDSQSQWIGPISFMTLCEAFNTPFLETFEADSASEECWRIVDEYNSDFTFHMNVTSFPYEGEQHAGMFTGSNGANNDWLISPTINVTEGQRLRFYYRTYSPWYNEDLVVRLSTNGIDPSEFTTILFDSETASFDINNDYYKEMVLNIPAGITGPVNFAWHIPQMPASPLGYRGQILLIDNVIVEDIPACPDVYNVAISNITDTSIQVAWEVAGSETQWEVIVQPFGMDTPSEDYITLTATNPVVISDLDPAQKYEVFVRAVCSETSQSNWTEAIEVNTLCSFENLCEYTITLSGAGSMGVGGGINVIQNGVVLQTLEFPTGPWSEIPAPVDFTLFLCTGVEFSLFWDSIGTTPGQYPGAMVTITDSDGNVVSSTDLGTLPSPRSTFYTGIALCGIVTCPQPTDLASDDFSVLSWTAGGSETQWEVAIQPFENGTLPVSGTLVTTNSYTPQAADYTAGTNATYEFFVRAICGEGDESFWSGPFVFARNNNPSTAITLPVNTTEECAMSVTASFNGAIPSTEEFTCNGINGGDIWYEFQATSATHLIGLNKFSGDYYYSSGNAPYAPVTLSLYKDNEGVLELVTCTYNNAMATMYSSELEIGSTYKLRITKNMVEETPYIFEVCVKTIVDPCSFAVINGDMEQPVSDFGAITSMITQNVLQGWRYNLFGYWSVGAFFQIGAINAMGLTPYDGAQLTQLFASDLGADVDVNNMDGLYQDFDTSEVTQYDFSFAHATRSGGSTLDLYAGPPQGPFELIYESQVSTMTWTLQEGIYNVPEGQDVTRFYFRSRNDALGQLLDAVNFIPNNSMITEDQTLTCNASPLTVQANGVGIWSADENNPGTVIIENAENSEASISGFVVSGTYTFYWTTRYCQETLTVVYDGFDAVPEVTSPVTYCLGEEASPLTASQTEGYSLVWFTEAIGGEGVASITPDTETEGTTTYYVAYQDENGCQGVRTEVQVVVNPVVMAVIAFEYSSDEYCWNDSAEMITPITETDFTEGGSFSVTPEGLDIDETTGAINIAASQPGMYEVVYTIADSECLVGGAYTVLVVINAPSTPVVEFAYEELCTTSEEALPVLAEGFTQGGTFTSDSGIYVHPETGALDVRNAGVGTYVITYEVAADASICQEGASYSYTVEIHACQIQKGISPNGDGWNDYFDLTGMGVKKLSIYSRYGREVYTKSNYVNEWNGQDKNDNELPTGTYFYSIERSNGENVTGWIYVNRSY